MGNFLQNVSPTIKFVEFLRFSFNSLTSSAMMRKYSFHPIFEHKPTYSLIAKCDRPMKDCQLEPVAVKSYELFAVNKIWPSKSNLWIYEDLPFEVNALFVSRVYACRQFNTLIVILCKYCVNFPLFPIIYSIYIWKRTRTSNNWKQEKKKERMCMETK